MFVVLFVKQIKLKLGFKDLMSVIKMNVIQQNEKIMCQCGSHIKNAPANIKQHNKTITHQKYVENMYVGVLPTFGKEIITEEKENIGINKEMNEINVKETNPSKNALRVRAFRERQKASLGEDAYKEKMRTEKKESRAATKVKKDIKIVSEGGVIIEPTKKETKEDLADYVATLLTDLEIQKTYNKPAIVKLVKQKIKRFDTQQGSVKNCKQLVGLLDKSSLVSDKYGEVKEKSLQNYMNNIEKVYTAMFGKKMDCSDFEWTRDIKRVEKTINEMPRLRKSKSNKTETDIQTKRQRFTALKSILERLDGFTNEAKAYKKLQDAFQVIVSQTRGENKLSVLEKQNWMDWEKIVNYNDKNWTDESRLIHGLYTLIPPRRLEYGLLKFARRRSLPQAESMDKNFNYIVTNTKDLPAYIVLNRYKTDYKYKTYIIHLSTHDSPLFKYTKLVELIKAMMKNTNKPMKHNEPFFVNDNDKMFVNDNGDNSFGKRINEVFKNTGKNISCNILRHSFITNFLGKSSFSTMKDNTLDEVSKSLGHSAQMFQSYRRIFDTPEARIEQFLKDDKE